MKPKLSIIVMTVNILMSISNINSSAINAAEVPTWTKYIEQSTDTLQGVAYGNGLLVVVGDNGLIRTSVDGDNWLYQSSGSKSNLKDVAYGNGVFAACGDSGTIITSSDGSKWTSIKSNTEHNLSTVIFDSSKFIAIGDYGTILISTDAVAWDIISTSINDNLTDICMNNGTYVIGGSKGLYISKDLRNWLHIKETENYAIRTIACDGTNFVAITAAYNEGRIDAGGYRDYSHVFISADGINWSNHVVYGVFGKVLWDGKRFFAINAPTAMWGPEQNIILHTSNDGVEWSDIRIENTGILNDVVWTGEYYIGVGYQNNILKSIYVDKWTNLTNPTLSKPSYFVSDGASLVCLGSDGYIMVTKDMKSWTCVKISDAHHLDSIFWKDGIFYIWGYEKENYFNHCLFISKDLNKWDKFKFTTEQFTSISNENMSRIIYNGSRFVCGLAWSDDGIEWDKSVPEFLKVYDSFYNGLWDGRNYYQVGTSIISSSDGIKWKSYSITENDILKGIAYSGNRYVAVGSHTDIDNQKGVVYYSTDGKQWTRVLLDPSGLNAVLWTGKSFIAAGYDGTIMESKDGIKWSNHITNTQEEFISLSVWKNGLVAVSNLGSIFYLNGQIDFDRLLSLSPNAPKTEPVPDEILDWNVIDLETEYEFMKVIWTGKEFAAVGDNGIIAFSSDGKLWDKRTIGGVGRITGIAYNGKKFVAIGQNLKDEKSIILSSSDGITWTQHPLKNKSNNSGNVIWNGKIFVALGESPVQFYSSEDGEVWNEFSTQALTDYHRSVIWDGTKFISLAAGIAISSYVSQDGIDWTYNWIELPYGHVSNIHYLGGALITTGQGTIATSTDGSTWSIGNCPTSSPIKDLIYDGKRYLAFTESNRILQSENVKDWEFKYLKTPFTFNSVCWNGNIYVGVGKGKIATACPMSFPKVLIDNTPLLFDFAPVNVNNRVLVPMRAIFEQFGTDVEWDASKKQVTVAKDDKTIRLTIGDPIARINDSEYVLDSPAIIVNGRTMVPIRFICSSLGADVEWLDKEKTVNIKIFK